MLHEYTSESVRKMANYNLKQFAEVEKSRSRSAWQQSVPDSPLDSTFFTLLRKEAKIRIALCNTCQRHAYGTRQIADIKLTSEMLC